MSGHHGFVLFTLTTVTGFGATVAGRGVLADCTGVGATVVFR